jgi:putative flippase GtrA
VIPELLRFAVVGAVGFLVSAIAVTAASLRVDLYTTGAIGWLVAVNVTWYLNRNWTFRRAQKRGAGTEWVKFVSANSAGFMAYLAAYSAAIAWCPVCGRWPVCAVALGSLAGLCINFGLSRELVFNSRR